MKSDLLWVEKYRPKKIADILGNEEAKSALVEWLKSKRRSKKSILLYGPPGVGKTALVNAAANEFGFRIIEMNASDTRTEKAVNRVARPATSFVALDKFSSDSKGNLLFLDEVDGIAGNEDRGGVAAIIKIIETSLVPVIMAANDPNLEKLRPLKKVCALVRFRQIRIPLIIATLRKICQKEGVEAEFEALERIALNSVGDVRSAINDLQSLAETDKKLTLKDTAMLSLRNKNFSMEETLRQFFSANSIVEASILLNRSNVDYDDFLLSVSDNLPRRYADFAERAKAYNEVSRADIFRGRIGTENWHLLKYFYNSMTKAASINAHSQKSFELISPPIRIITLFWTKGKRTTLETICGKIGAKCHVSRNTAKEKIVPFLKILLEKQKYSSIIPWLKLTLEEADFLKNMNKL